MMRTLVLSCTLLLMLLLLLLINVGEGAAHEQASASTSATFKLKRKQVSVYFRDTLNVTDFVVVQGPNGRAITPVDAPFGTIYIFNDLVTEGPDRDSTPLGNITGAFIASTHDYGSDFLTPLVLTLSNNSGASSPSNPDLQGLHGTLTMLGIDNPIKQPQQPQPITGGTGSFAFALGSHTMVPIDVSTYDQLMRLDLDLYWPPYTTSF